MVNHENLSKTTPETAPRKFFIYEAISLTQKVFGLLTGGFDCELLAKRRGISLDEAMNLKENALKWLKDKFDEKKIEGALFFFTEKGKEKFDKNSFTIIRDAMHEGWAIELKEFGQMPYGELIYEDEDQVAIKPPKSEDEE